MPTRARWRDASSSRRDTEAGLSGLRKARRARLAAAPSRYPVAAAMTDPMRGAKIGTPPASAAAMLLIWLSRRIPMIASRTTGPIVAQVADLEFATPLSVSIVCWMSET